MYLYENIEKMKFDVRLIEFNLRAGKITTSEVENYYKNLEDNSGFYEEINLKDGAAAEKESEKEREVNEVENSTENNTENNKDIAEHNYENK